MEATRRIRVGLLFVIGVSLASYPLAQQLLAQAGAGQTAPAMLHTDNLDPRLRGFRWRSIGPTGQGGRIDDIAVVETTAASTSTFYLGFATGGLWKTVNNGITYEPIFDRYSTHSIGDIAIAPSNPNVLYVGTGEPNNRQSSSFGDGMFKSTDAGATFTQIGLRDTQSIARVVVHPKNPDIVWVAAVGHLFGPNAERGVFMTTDGGATWTKTLFVDNDTGATDLIVDPSNPNNLFAAMYQRRRSACCFVGSGPGSGIHQSADGGKTWRKLTGNGLPTGVMGRIGLDISRSNPNVIYAQIETGVMPTPQPAAAVAQDQPAGRGAGGGGQRGGGGGGRGDAPAPPNPNASGIWRSNDKGKTWTFMSNENNRPMYYSQIRVDPTNPEIVYVGGQNAAKSIDGAKTFESIQGGMGHVDNHALWINPHNNQHVMYGNDGSLDVSYDGGQNWESARLWAVGQPYHVSVDMRRPYYVCTGLQDNGSWCGPSSVRSSPIRMYHWYRVGGGDGFQTQVDPTDHRVLYSESQNGNINRYDLGTGRSGSVRPTPPDPGGGGGRGGGGGGGGGGQGNVVPPPQADTQFTFAWNSPIRISPHNPRKILFGGDRFFVSLDRGETWTMSQRLGKNIDYSERSIMGVMYSSPRCGGGGRAGGGGGAGGRAGGPPPGPPAKTCILSKGDGVGANEAGTVIEIAESPVVPNLYWAGTGDGNIQVSQDGGLSWTEVSRNIPGGTREYWVSGIEASWFDAGTAYVSLDGHHSDDLRPHVFKTTDYGKSWTSISGNLPNGNVNSIRQDPVNRNLLYVAAEFGFYISLDDGKSWQRFMPNLPMVRVDEVVVHPRERDLVLATHGRSIWIMDDISALQQMTSAVTGAEATLFRPRDAVAWRPDPRNGTSIPGGKWWAGQNAPPGTAIAYYLRSAPTGDVRLTIANTATGQAVRTCTGTKEVGINRFQWTFATDGGGGGGGGRGGGGRGGGAPETPAPAPTPFSDSCAGGDDGGGRGGRGGGGGGGGLQPGVYRVTLNIGGKDVGSQTFSILEDIWMNER